MNGFMSTRETEHISISQAAMPANTSITVTSDLTWSLDIFVFLQHASGH